MKVKTASTQNLLLVSPIGGIKRRISGSIKTQEMLNLLLQILSRFRDSNRIIKWKEAHTFMWIN
jgi:hypothetical protein